MLKYCKLDYLYIITIKKSSYYEPATEASQVGVIPYLSVITPVLNNPFNNIETGTENYSKYQSDMKMSDGLRC